MYDFRDYMAAESGMELIVHINPDGVAKNINPFDHGSAIHTDIMKTQGLKQALTLMGSMLPLVEPVVMRKKPREGAHLLVSEIKLIAGIRKIKDRSFGSYITGKRIRERAFEYSRCLIGPSWTFGSTSTKSIFPSCRYILRRSVP